MKGALFWGSSCSEMEHTEGSKLDALQPVTFQLVVLVAIDPKVSLVGAIVVNDVVIQVAHYVLQSPSMTH